ncbi:hypothetical protein PsYK624_138570 [Phanerochaete sordida]|uniref:Uncharacterized protein n=1 Tax=Phanerochaete sordida TaxID=48140 RepID=A0A9P3GMU0_9APHY|nr:hypothetical protein PsYK624_138570 [Phanerochaete sordida]
MLMLGRNLDAHAPAEPAGDATAAALLAARADIGAPSDSSHQCLQGRECYAGSLLFTTAACARAERVHAPEVLWDAPEDE